MKKLLMTSAIVVLLLLSLVSCDIPFLDREDDITVEDGYVVVNGVKTEYEVKSEDKIEIVDGYVVVNGVKTEHAVDLSCAHEWKTVTTAPTCTKGGYDTMTCKVCDKSVKTNLTDPKDHAYKYESDYDYHWQACKNCSDTKDKAAHKLDSAGVCTVCLLPVSSTPGVTYEISGNVARVVGYNGTSKIVKIADKHNGVPVTEIYQEAFKYNYDITSVIIGNNVTSIGEKAFYDCYRLSSVVIPDSVKEIGNCAFDGCSSLSSLSMGNGVTSIGTAAFRSCYGLSTITIPESVTSIGSGAFSYCNSSLYTEYSYGKYVGDEENPYALLVEITNKNLSSYTIHEDTRFIAPQTFFECSRLTSITIPDSVTSIGYGAFGYCTSLTSVDFGDGLKTIEWMAFNGCSGLTSIVIPDSMTSIGEGAFAGCTALTDIYYTGSSTQWQKIKIGQSNTPISSATKHYNYAP